MKKAYTRLQGLIFTLFISCLCLLLISSKSIAETIPSEEVDQARLTLLIYMCGSDLEGRTGSGTMDLQEMMASGFDEEAVNVIVMAGGTQRWLNRLPADETSIYEIHQQDMVKVQYNPAMNMGDPLTLTQFLDFGYVNYPAEKYALILWDHGGGPLKGVCWDITADKDNLRIPELEKALADSQIHAAGGSFEWIGFDACLMSSIEVAHTLSPYASYMIASQELEPGAGWSYSFLKDIEKDSSGAVTGRRIVEDYFDASGTDNGFLTLSCLDLGQTGYVEDCLDAFFLDLSEDLNTETFTGLSKLRQGVRGFGRTSGKKEGSDDCDLADLTDLIVSYTPQAPAKAQKAADALDQMIVYSRSSDDSGHGVSVYYPYYNKELFRKKWGEVCSDLNFSSGYISFLGNFSRIWMGEQLGNWKSLQTPVEGGVGNEELFSVQLSPEQMGTLAYAHMIVLEESVEENSNEFSQIYETGDVSLGEDGTLSAHYSGESLYVFDENDQPLCGPLHYRVVDDRILIYAKFFQEGGSIFGDEDVLFICTREEGRDKLSIRSVQVYDDQTGIYSNRLSFDPASYKEVYFPMYLKRKPFSENSQLPPFEQWVEKNSEDGQDGGIYRAMYLPREWQFGFSDEQMDSNERYVSFQITDSQGNVHATPLLPVKNKSISKIDMSSGSIKTEDYEVSFSGLVKKTKLHAGLEFAIEVNNLTDRKIQVSVKDNKLVINRHLPLPFEWVTEITGHQTERNKKNYWSDELTGIGHIDTIELTLYVGDKTHDVLIDNLNIDLDEVTEEFREQDVCTDVYENDVTQWNLTSFEYDEVRFRRGFSGILYGKNITNHKVYYDFFAVIVDGVELELDVVSTDLEFILSPGEERYGRFVIETDQYDMLQKRDENLLEDVGISQVHDLIFVGKDDRGRIIRIPLTLNEPYMYRPDLADASLDDVERTEIYKTEDFAVFLRKILVSGTGVVLVMDMENFSDEEKTVYFPTIKVNEGQGSVMLHSIIPDEYEGLTILAHSLARRYIDVFGLGAQEMVYNSIDMTMSVYGADQDINAMRQISIDFLKRPLTGQSKDSIVALSDIQLESTDILLETDTDQPLIDSVIELPDNAAQYWHELSLSLSDYYSEEELKSITTVSAMICRKLDEKKVDMGGEYHEGDWLLSSLAHVAVNNLEGICTGMYTGLVPMVNDQFMSRFQLDEQGKKKDQLVIRLAVEPSVKVKKEYLTSSGLYANDAYLNYDTKIDYETNTGEIKNCRVRGFDEDFTNWPAGRFESIDTGYSFMEYIEADPFLKRRSEGTVWIEDDGVYCLEGKSLHVRLVPITELTDEIYVVYLIERTDGDRDIIAVPY